MSDEFFTTEEIAEKLKVIPATVRSWISQGKLPAINLDGSYRVYATDLQKFLDERYNQPAKKKRSEKKE